MKLLSVPNLRQTPSYCGPTSLKAVLAYYGLNKSEAELTRLSGATKSKGVEASGIVRAAHKLGFHAEIRDGSTLSQLSRLVLDKKIPVIVDWFSTDEGHYSVVVGLDQKKIHLMDPELGAIRTLPVKDFERVWFDFAPPVMQSAKDLILRRMIIIQK